MALSIDKKEPFYKKLVHWWYYYSKEYRITPLTISHPGDIQELIELEKKNREKKNYKKNNIHMGIAVEKKTYNNVIEQKLQDYIPQDFYMPDSWRNRHFLCFGTTGSGKTKLMTYMIYQDILKGHDLIILNPKSDPLGNDEHTAGNELLSYIVQGCIEAGRLEDLMIMTPVFPEFSVKINPLKHFKLEEELIQHVISSMPPSKEAFYENVAYEVSTAIITALILQERIHNRNPVINFMDIKKKVDYTALKILGDQIEFFKNFPDAAVREKINDTIVTIKQMGHSPQDFFAKISSSLRTVLTTLTSSVTGELIGKARDNPLIERLQAGKGVVFVCNTDSILMPRSSFIINRILVSMAIAIAGRKGSEGMKLSKPLCIYADEGHNTLFRGIDELFGKGRSAGMFIHLFTQGKSDIEKIVGDVITNSILNNINTWLIMKMNDAGMAEYLSEVFPSAIRWMPYPDIGGGKQLSIMFKPKETPIIHKDNIKNLKPRFYYLKYENYFFKGQVPFVPPPSIRIVMPVSREEIIKQENTIPLPIPETIKEEENKNDL